MLHFKIVFLFLIIIFFELYRHDVGSGVNENHNARIPSVFNFTFMFNIYENGKLFDELIFSFHR